MNNIANHNIMPSVHFSALLVEGDATRDLESTLREQGCSVRRVGTCASADEAFSEFDIVVIRAAGFSADAVVDLARRAAVGGSVLVQTESNELAVRVVHVGASAIVGSTIELASAQVGHLLSVVELKRKLARQSATTSSVSVTAPDSATVPRRSAPFPRETTPDAAAALDVLVQAAEAIVPMHHFQRVYVDYALRRFGGNKVHTASALGVDRRTIQRWARARAESVASDSSQELSANAPS